jgi:hypothetical protein
MNGSGLLILNAPWQFDVPMRPAIAALQAMPSASPARLPGSNGCDQRISDRNVAIRIDLHICGVVRKSTPATPA